MEMERKENYCRLCNGNMNEKTPNKQIKTKQLNKMVPKMRSPSIPYFPAFTSFAQWRKAEWKRRYSDVRSRMRDKISRRSVQRFPGLSFSLQRDDYSHQSRSLY